MSSLNCDYGGHKLFPKPGYWRFDENSTNFLLCPLKEVCLGGENADYFSLEFYSGECEAGYEGPLCNLCTEDYGKLDKNHCGKCASSISFIIAGVKLFLGIVSSIYSLYLGTDFGIQICQPVTSQLREKVIENYIMKLFIYHFQVRNRNCIDLFIEYLNTLTISN